MLVWVWGYWDGSKAAGRFLQVKDAASIPRFLYGSTIIE